MTRHIPNDDALMPIRSGTPSVSLLRTSMRAVARFCLMDASVTDVTVEYQGSQDGNRITAIVVSPGGRIDPDRVEIALDPNFFCDPSDTGALVRSLRQVLTWIFVGFVTADLPPGTRHRITWSVPDDSIAIDPPADRKEQ